MRVLLLGICAITVVVAGWLLLFPRGRPGASTEGTAAIRTNAAAFLIFALVWFVILYDVESDHRSEVRREEARRTLTLNTNSASVRTTFIALPGPTMPFAPVGYASLNLESRTPRAFWDSGFLAPATQELAVAAPGSDLCLAGVSAFESQDRIELEVRLAVTCGPNPTQSVIWVYVDLAAPVGDRTVVGPDDKPVPRVLS